MNISELLDQAKDVAKVRSDRQLGFKADLHPVRFPSWRRGHSLPSDETLLKLCSVAGVDPLPWLIWLNVQRTDGETRAAYERHLKHVTSKKTAKGSQVIAA